MFGKALMKWLARHLLYMYMGSSWPIIGQWKQDNPRAANQVVMGLIFVIAASTVASLISFP